MESPNITSKLLSVDEVARLLGVSNGLIYKLSQQGELPFIRIGRRICILETDLGKFLEINHHPK